MSTKPQLDGLAFDSTDGELTRFFPHAEAIQSATSGAWKRLTTDELLAEVLRRSAGDTPELRLHSQTVIRAQLAETDRDFADISTRAELQPASEVIGTTEIELAEEDAD